MSTAADALEAIATQTAPEWQLSRTTATQARATFLLRANDTGLHYDTTITAPTTGQDPTWRLTLGRATVDGHGIPRVTTPDRAATVRPVVVADDLLAVLRGWVAELSLTAS